MVEIFTKKHFISMPWKNGGGTTLELYKISNTNSTSLNLRISIAEVVKNGQFSLFPGIDRHLLLLEGEGFHLKSTIRNQLINQKFALVSFSGEEDIECTLVHGPCRDFNVMINRRFGKSNITIEKMVNKIKSKSNLKFIYDSTLQILYKMNYGDELVIKEENQGPFIVIDIVR